MIYSAWVARARIAAVFTALLVAWSLLPAAPAFGMTFPTTVGLKDCVTPINVGDPYSCEIGIASTGATPNTLTVDLLTDEVFTSVGTVTRSYAINQSSFGGGLILTRGATCDASKCTLPPGGLLMTPFFTQYTTVIGDFPGISDTGTFRFRNLCDVVSSGCNTSPAESSATASADIIEPPSSCQPTGNPSGNSPGAKGNGPANSDGLHVVSGRLFSDTTVIPFPGGGDLWPANTRVKYTERGSTKIVTKMAGPNSAIQYQIQAPGDLYAGAPKGDPNAIFCSAPG